MCGQPARKAALVIRVASRSKNTYLQLEREKKKKKRNRLLSLIPVGVLLISQKSYTCDPRDKELGVRLKKIAKHADQNKNIIIIRYHRRSSCLFA